MTRILIKNQNNTLETKQISKTRRKRLSMVPKILLLRILLCSKTTK